MKILKKKETTLKSRLTPFTIVLLVILLIYIVSLCWPLLWALMTAFKTNYDFSDNPTGLPKVWMWNFTYVFKLFKIEISTAEGAKEVGMAAMYMNAILYAIGCAFTATAVPCLTAYLCAKFPYRFSKVIYLIVIVAMILPIVGNLPSEIQMSKLFSLYDHIWGLWIMKANFLGMYFLVFYSVLRNVPQTYTEAAKMDGAGNSVIFLKIIIPIVRNTFLTVMLIKFIEFWNDYQIPLIYLPSHPTIAVGMYEMSRAREYGLSTVPMRMAGSMLMLVPILVIFLIFQKRLIGNLTIGGIKG